MSDINERIAEMFKSGQHRSVSAFARSVDAKVPTVTDTIKGNTEPRFTLLESILRANPDVSAEWLMRGEGSMYRSQCQQRVARDVSVSNTGGGNAPVNGDIFVEKTGCDEQLLKFLQEQLDKKDEQIHNLSEQVKDKEGQAKKLLGLLCQKQLSGGEK